MVPPVIRTSLLTGAGTAGLCDGAFSLDMNAVWTNQPAENSGAGATVQAQLWYRDPFNTANNQATSLSDAIEFVVRRNRRRGAGLGPWPWGPRLPTEACAGFPVAHPVVPRPAALLHPVAP